MYCPVSNVILRTETRVPNRVHETRGPIQAADALSSTFLGLSCTLVLFFRITDWPFQDGDLCASMENLCLNIVPAQQWARTDENWANLNQRPTARSLTVRASQSRGRQTIRNPNGLSVFDYNRDLACCASLLKQPGSSAHVESATRARALISSNLRVF